MIKIYIASPYRLGDTAVNVKRQMDIADKLIENGFNPFIPLLYHFQHMVHPRTPNEWLDIDLEWVKICDCVLRLNGESSGADIEVEYANSQGIPVYFSHDDNIDYEELKRFINECDYINSHFKNITRKKKLEKINGFS